MLNYEIDHLFICVSAGALQAERLITLGMTEGSPNRHPGQGTANRRFFFANAMLELLWVDDPDEAQSQTSSRTQLWQRWNGRKTTTSPFGVCLRPVQPEISQPPFAAWEYRPAFLPDHHVIHVGNGSPLTEPMWFFLAFGKRPDRVESSVRQPLEHPLGVRELTSVQIISPTADKLSPSGRDVEQAVELHMTAGQQHLLDLTFDGHENGRQEDLRPDLPLIVRW